jgi:hypothetical protein
LTAKLLLLAGQGDGLLIQPPFDETLVEAADRRGVELVRFDEPGEQGDRDFTPWGWTTRTDAIGRSVGARVSHPDLQVIREVNSKLWSFALEQQLGVAIEGSAAASDFEELARAVANACPAPSDKWVIKSPFGFAARDRVLGRGPFMEHPQAAWVRRRFELGEILLFQPWLKVSREYGIVMEVHPGGNYRIQGISDLQTNGAGTGTGYILGRSVERRRMQQLEKTAEQVAIRLFEAGYYGPVGIDALEHSEGLLPLLEINARYTMGFIAIAAERSINPSEPVFWSTT